MAAKRTIHVVGTGTLGEPVISLLLNIRQELNIDEITFHKNRPLLNDRVKIQNLIKKGAKLVVEAEKMADFEKIGLQPTYIRQVALSLTVPLKAWVCSIKRNGTSTCLTRVVLLPRAVSLALARCMPMGSTTQLSSPV